MAGDDGGAVVDGGLGITWASPLPPTRSGVADYAVEVIPHLARHARIGLVEPPDDPGDAGTAWRRSLPSCRWDAPPPAGSVHLLHLGNNPYHLWVARRLRRFGGVVVLHDPVLHHLLVEEAAADSAWERFGDELELAHPGHGRGVAEARRWGATGALDPFLLPATACYLRLARAAVVHSDRAAAMARRACPGLPVVRVPLACGALPAGDRKVWRERLGVGAGTLVAIHLGFLTPAKGLGVIVRALAALAGLGVDVRLVVAGEGSESGRLARSIREAGLADRVNLWGWASEADLGGLLAAADVGLVPRYPSAGETSAAVLRCLAAATPVVVAGTRQFLEFPPAAAFRVPPGDVGVAEVVRVLAWLARDTAARQESRVAARRAWVEGGHEPAGAARSLAAAVREHVDAMV